MNLAPVLQQILLDENLKFLRVSTKKLKLKTFYGVGPSNCRIGRKHLRNLMCVWCCYKAWVNINVYYKISVFHVNCIDIFKITTRVKKSSSYSTVVWIPQYIQYNSYNTFLLYKDDKKKISKIFFSSLFLFIRRLWNYNSQISRDFFLYLYQM